MNDNNSTTEIYADKAAPGPIYGVIFVTVQILFGFSANALFLLTYIYMKTTYRCGAIVYYELLLYMCVLDIVTCSVIMPMDVLQQQYPFTLVNDVGCIVQQYTKSVLITSSMVMALIIAVHRYRKILAPLGRHMSPAVARFVFGAVVIGSMVIHVPLIMVTGKESVQTFNSSPLVACGFDDERKDLKEVKALAFVWISIICLLTIVTVSLYAAIGVHIHRKDTRNLNSPTPMSSMSFFPPSFSTSKYEMTEKVKYKTHDKNVQLQSIPTTRDKINISRDLKDYGGSVNKVLQTHNQPLCVNYSDMPETKTLMRSKTVSQDYHSQAAKAQTYRPRSQELLSTLKVAPSYARRTRSFGNINDINTLTKVTLRTKQQQQRKQRHDDILRVGTLISVTYFLSVIPFSVALPMVLYGERFGDQTVLVHIGVRSLYLRSALNPLLYGLFDSRLRKFFAGVYRRLKEKLC